MTSKLVEHTKIKTRKHTNIEYCWGKIEWSAESNYYLQLIPSRREHDPGPTVRSSPFRNYEFSPDKKGIKLHFFYIAVLQRIRINPSVQESVASSECVGCRRENATNWGRKTNKHYSRICCNSLDVVVMVKIHPVFLLIQLFFSFLVSLRGVSLLQGHLEEITVLLASCFCDCDKMKERERKNKRKSTNHIEVAKFTTL